MIYKEENRDLFAVPEEYYLAHCISADFGMAAGIVVEFNRRFDLKNKLKRKYSTFEMFWDASDEQRGTCLLEGRVFNLITKRNYWQKPTYKTLRKSLEAMRVLIGTNNVQKLAMPVIGCGLDRLEWNKVSTIIKDVFKDTDIEILVCMR